MERKHRALLLALPTVLTLLFFFVAPMVYILVHTLHENGLSNFVNFFSGSGWWWPTRPCARWYGRPRWTPSGHRFTRDKQKGAADMLLTDKVAMITGGGRGIGEASARRLAEHGAKVILADMNLEAAQAVATSYAVHGYAAPRFLPMTAGFAASHDWSATADMTDIPVN